MRTSMVSGKPFEADGKFLLGTPGNDKLRGGEGDDVIRAGAGNDRLWGGGGDDALFSHELVGELPSQEMNIMRGGAGDDTYYIGSLRDKVIEKAGEGVDTVRTAFGYTLPDHVENLVAPFGQLLDERPLVGNALDNVLTGAPFSYETILGLDGNDTLDGGGRAGALLDGGNGDDRLVLSFGDMLGGAGADLFVAGGRGAMTSPDATITVRDFNADQGDRVHIYRTETYDSTELFESGQLRFEAQTNQLILDFDPSTTSPTSVDQVIVLVGVDQFDAAWVTVGPSY